MRTFQVLLLALLAMITCELGLVLVKLPAPAVQAAPPNSVTFTPEDPHDTLKRQLTDITKRLGVIEQRQISDSKRLLVTCVSVRSLTSKWTAGSFDDWLDGVIKYCSAQGWWPKDLQHVNNFDVPFGP